MTIGGRMGENLGWYWKSTGEYGLVKGSMWCQLRLDVMSEDDD